MAKLVDMHDFNALSDQQLPLLSGQDVLEEVEAALLRAGAGLSVHVRHVYLPGEEVRTDRDDATRRLHGRLHGARQRYVPSAELVSYTLIVHGFILHYDLWVRIMARFFDQGVRGCMDGL